MIDFVPAFPPDPRPVFLLLLGFTILGSLLVVL